MFVFRYACARCVKIFEEISGNTIFYTGNIFTGKFVFICWGKRLTKFRLVKSFNTLLFLSPLLPPSYFFRYGSILFSSCYIAFSIRQFFRVRRPRIVGCVFDNINEIEALTRDSRMRGFNLYTTYKLPLMRQQFATT